MLNPSEDTIERLCFLLSHELRTPITALQGAVDLLRMQSLQEKLDVDQLLGLAAESTGRLTRIVEDILDWYEITHSATLFYQSCNAALLIQQVVATMQSFAAQRQIQIQLQTPTCIPLRADLHHLDRAFSYLVHNAIKFSRPNQRVKITATCIHTPQVCDHLAVPHVLMAIIDEGIGIPEADLEKVFQPFYQVDTSDARSYGGLGLELSIGRQIIIQHNGKIWVESQLGQGSTFYVALPMDESPTDRMPARKAEAGKNKSTGGGA